jgi:hypothetical protein
LTTANRYTRIIEAIFQAHYERGKREFAFDRDEIVRVAKRLRIPLPKNLGDILYSFRYRVAMPESISATAPEGEHWVIRPAGRSKYCFALVRRQLIEPSAMLVETKVPDATPGIIAMHALSDEQALLAKLRYNRLIDVFTGVTCYSLQNHLRTSVKSVGQVETDEIYVGVDRSGAQYVIPVQAKGGRDKSSIVQIEQDVAVCADKFPSLICRPVAAQFMRDDLIALFEFVETDDGVAIAEEKHYRLVPYDEITADDLATYRSRLPG